MEETKFVQLSADAKVNFANMIKNRMLENAKKNAEKSKEDKK